MDVFKSPSCRYVLKVIKVALLSLIIQNQDNSICTPAARNSYLALTCADVIITVVSPRDLCNYITVKHVTHAAAATFVSHNTDKSRKKSNAETRAIITSNRGYHHSCFIYS